MKKAVVFGASGQDGFFLCRLLKSKGYIVQGVSRKEQSISSPSFGIDFWSCWDFKNHYMLDDIICWKDIDEVYFLSGQSSVGYSFSCPKDTYLSFTLPLSIILDSIRRFNTGIRLYNACSSEVFGNTLLEGASENTIMQPISPYGYAKKASAELVEMYRSIYDIFAVNGFLFNHESMRRPDGFFSRKLVTSAKDVKNGKIQFIDMGPLEAIRDWGWAEDYVIPMNLMLQQNEPEDFIIASGKGHSLLEFATSIFAAYDLNFSEHYRLNPEFIRKNDINISVGNPEKATSKLKWSSNCAFSDIITKLTRVE